MTRRDRLLAGLAALALAVLLQIARGNADWGPSEGVYALSSRLFLHGAGLYHGLVASQPPWVYLFGAGTLAIHDSLDTLRLACGLLQVLAALFAAESVWRLTANRRAAILTAPLVMVTPWAVHQHGLLLPEQLGAPLLLGAALFASRESTARWAGVLAGVAVFAKLPFLVPAVAIVVASPWRRTVATSALATLAAQAAAFTILFGTAFWRAIITAQSQAGGGLEYQIGPFVQAAWNLLPLVVFVAVALVYRSWSADKPLTLTVGAAALGTISTTITILKPGTGLNVLVPSEPLLTTLAVAGVVWASREARRTLAIRGAVALGALLLAQSASLLINPDDPQPFHRPFSATAGWKVQHDRSQMDDLVAQAKACPPGSVYAGPPLVAFIAHRHAPDNQPDYFIVSRAKMYSAVFKRVRDAAPRCG